MDAYLWARDVAECWSVCLGSVRTLTLFPDGTNERSNELSWDQHKKSVITQYEGSLKADLRIMSCEIPSAENSLRQVLMLRPTPGSLEGAWKLPGSSSSFPSCPVDCSGKTYVKAKQVPYFNRDRGPFVRTPCWQWHNTSTACHQFYGAEIITPRREKGRL